MSPQKQKNSWLNSSRESLEYSANNSAGSNLGEVKGVNAQTLTSFKEVLDPLGAGWGKLIHRREQAGATELRALLSLSSEPL